MELTTKTGSRRGTARSGFTLVELMIVMSIMLILISIAVPMYTRSVTRAKEAVLRDQLFTMRQLIDEYTLDKQAAPQTLDDLVSEGYLRELPKDPFTVSNSTWKVQMEDAMKSADQTQPGIVDVHSGSDRTGLDGSAYSTW
jgi:general secretion pathway protein G